MTISVHSNYASLVTQNTLAKTNNALTTSMERLSTGFRINSASDDAAGLQIANRLEAQTRGMGVAMRNAQDGISMMQTSEGAMDEITNIALRMNDLALQGSNGSNSADDKKALQAEFKALSDEMQSIVDNTTFGGQKLLASANGFAAGAVDFQIGATSGETLSVDASTSITAIQTALTAAAAGDLETDANAAINLLSGTGGVIETLGTARAEFGANINRLEHTVVNLQNMSENTEAAKGRIMDTNYAAEGANMSKQQMLMQSGSSILSATKMVPQLAMGMLG